MGKQQTEQSKEITTSTALGEMMAVDALAEALSAEPAPVTREEIDAALEQITELRRVAWDAGATEDTDEIKGLIEAREVLIARLLDQERAADLATLHDAIAAQQSLVGLMREDLEALAGDQLQEAQQQLRTEQAALDAMLARRDGTPEAANDEAPALEQAA